MVASNFHGDVWEEGGAVVPVVTKSGVPGSYLLRLR